MPSQDSITQHKADFLYSQAPISNITIYLIALLSFFFLQDYSHEATYIVWPLLLTLAASYRLSLWYQKKHNPDKYSAKQWIMLYFIGTGITGLAWGSLYFFSFSEPDMLLYVALLMILFGVTSAAVPVLSISLAAFYSYITPLIISFVFNAYQLLESYHLFLLLASVAYFAMLSFLARNANNHMSNSIVLELKNKNLIQQLQEEIEQRESQIKKRTEQLEHSNQALAVSEERLQNVISGAELGYWDWYYQTGKHEVNDRWLEMLGLDRSDISDDVSDWAALIHPEDKERMMAIVKHSIKNKTPYVGDFRMRHKNGHWVWIQGSGSLVESHPDTNEPIRLCGTHQDISHRKIMEKELEYRAKHDSLTHLYNRVELEKHFQNEVYRAQRYHHKLSLFMIDIDHFKQINDTYGHKAGDQTLSQFAAFLQQTIRTTDYAARYGGEEFVIILPETSKKEAEELAERLRAKTAESTIKLSSTSINITISLGIASYPEDAETCDKLLESADAAMYQAKQNGRNRIQSA